MKPNEGVCGRVGLQFHIVEGSVTASARLAEAPALTMALGAGRARKPRDTGIYLSPLSIWQE